jgi:hypothetical protein
MPAIYPALATYEGDILAWSNEQAALLRAGRWGELDQENLAEEILDVGKSEKRELASRMAVLLAHLLKWQAQPERISPSWRGTIREQRRMVAIHLDDVPSLRNALTDPKWQARAWSQAVSMLIIETGLDEWPDACPWSIADVLTEGWFPGSHATPSQVRPSQPN